MIKFLLDRILRKNSNLDGLQSKKETDSKKSLSQTTNLDPSSLVRNQFIQPIKQEDGTKTVVKIYTGNPFRRSS